MAITKAITMSFRLDSIEICLAAVGKGQYELRFRHGQHDEFTTTLEEKDATVLGEGILGFVSMTTDKQ